MIPLQATTPEALASAVPGLTVPEARKAIAAVHRDEALAPRPGLGRPAVEALRTRTGVPSLALRATERAGDGFVRHLLETTDGHGVESVRIPLERPGRFSVCVSSQVGCALGCTFCATGRLGLSRNLEPWEIVEQVRVARRGLGARKGDAARPRVHGVVFQGMGEPLANLDAVLGAIEVLAHPAALAIDARAITVCTVGLPSGIRRLAREAPRVRLGISIGSARPEVRATLQPLEEVHPLGAVLDACAEHTRGTGLAPLWAMTLLDGVNDGKADARALAARARGHVERTGLAPRISILRYNPIGAGDPYRRTPREREDAFRDALTEEGFRSHLRYSGGADVRAACGQLAGSAARPPR